MAQILLGKEVTASLNEEIEEKVKTLKDIEDNQIVDVYGIVEKFLSENTYIIIRAQCYKALRKIICGI